MKSFRSSVPPIFILAGSVAALLLGSSPARSAALFWDTNGATAGSGNADGTWDATTANWSSDSTGASATGAWQAGSIAEFAAGTDFTGTRTITVSGTQSLAGIIADSEVTSLMLNGGALAFGALLGSIDTSALGQGGTTNANKAVISSALTGAGGLTINANGNTTSLSGGSSSALLQLGGDNSGLTGGIAITGGLVDALTSKAFGTNTITLSNGGGILDANHNVTLSNNIVLSTGGGTLRNYGSATTTYNGQISGTSLTFTDSGTRILTGNNTYSGGTTIGAGTVRLANSNALGSGAITFGGSSTLASVSGGAVISLGNAVTINSSVTASFDSGFADLTLNGAINGAGNLTKASTGTLTITGSNTGYSGTTTLGGAGTLAIGNDNALGTGTINLNNASGTFSSADSTAHTIANAITLSANTIFGTAVTGNLTFTGAVNAGAGAKTFVVNNASTTFTGAISTTGGATIALTKAGPGTLTLSGANSITDQMAITGGTLVLDYTTNNKDKLSSTANLVLGGGNLTINPNTSAATSQTVLNTTLNAGSSTITVNKDANADNSTLTLNTITRATGGTINVVYGGAGTGIAAALVNNTNTNGILGGWATVGGTDWAANSTNAAGGSIAALPAGGYINDSWSTGNDTTVTATGIVPAASTTNSLRFNAAGATTLTLSGVNTLTSGGILVTSAVGSATTTITGGTIEGAAGADLILNQYNTGGTLTIASVIADNTSATALTQAGPGTVVLSGTNTYTGANYLNGGITKVSADLNLGAAPASAVTDVVFNGGTLQYGGGFTLSTKRNITINSGGGTIDTNGNSVTVGSVISGSGALVRKGNGDLILTGTNTFSGGLIMNASTGDVRVNNASALGTGPVSVIGSSTLATSNGSAAVTLANPIAINTGVTLSVDSGYATVTLGGVISGAGSFKTTSSGTTVFTAANTYTGTTTIGNGDTLQLGTGATNGTVGTGAVTISNSAATLAFNRTNSLTLGNAISNPGIIAVNNTGSLTLTGTLTGAGSLVLNNPGALTVSGDASGFTGKATVNVGSLTLDYSTVNTSKLGDSSVLTLGNAALVLNGGSHTEAVGSTTLTAATSSSISQTNGTSVLAMGAITRNSSAVINFGASNIAQTTTSDNGAGILGGWATVGGTAWAMNDGSNNITAYSAYTPVPFAGVIADNAATNISLTGGTSGNITLGAPTVTVNTLQQGETSATTIDASAGTLRLGAAGGILLPSGTGALTIGTSANSGVLTAGGADNTAGEIVFNGTGNALTINSAITDNGIGSVSLTKAGGNDLVLSGANTYTGGTSLLGGTIRVSGSNTALGSGSLTVGGSSTLATAAGSSVATLANNTSLNSSFTTLTLDSSAANLSLGGVISGAGNIATTGTGGATTFTATNTYTGSTTIGTSSATVYSALQIGNGGSTGSIGAGNISFGGGANNLVYASTGATTLGAGSQLLSGGGNFVIMNGTITFGNSTAANTYTGDTVVYGGNLKLNSFLFNAGSGSSLGTGRLYIEPGGTATVSNSHPFGNNNSAQTLSLLGGTLTVSNAVYFANMDMAGGTVNGTADFRNGGSRTINVLPSAGPSTISAIYNPNAAGSNTATFYVNDGPATTDLMFSGNISNATGVVKAGLGTMRMTSSTASGYTGATILNSGVLNLDYSSSTLTSNMLSSSSSPTFAGGNLTITGNAATANTQTLGNVTVNAGGSSVSLVPGASGGSVALTLGNTWNRAVGGTLALSLPSGATLTAAPTTANGVLGYATVNGTDFASVSSGSVVALPTYNPDSYTSTDNTDVTALNPSPSAIASNSLRFNTAQTNTLTLPSGTSTIGTGGLLVSANVGVNNTVITGGTLTGSASGDLIIQQFDTAGMLTINSVIANNTAATGLTKAGPGTLILGGTNTYTGATFVNGGVLQFSAAGNLGSAASGITFGGGALRWASGTTTDITTGRTVTVGPGGGTIDTNGNNVTLSGSAFGAGSSGTLTKTGAGTLTLSAANTNFTGGVVVNQGKLIANNATALGNNQDQAIIVNSGATLDLAQGSTSSGHSVAVLRNFYINGGTMENVSGAPMRLGNIWLNGGTLNTQNGQSGSYTTFYLGTLQAGTAGANGTVFVEGSTPSFMTTTGTTNTAIQLGPNVAFQVADVTGDANPDLTVSVALANQSLDQNLAAGGFAKFGAGTMKLTAANTFTGQAVVNAGTLVVAGSISGSTSVQVNGGADLLMSGTGGNGQLKTTASLTLNGGTLSIDKSGATALGSGTITGFTGTQFSLTTGTLTFSAGSTLDLGTSGSATLLNFTGALTTDSGSLLTIMDWDFANSHDHIVFNDALSSTVLGQIQFSIGGNLYPAQQVAFPGANGYAGGYELVAAIPEPSTFVAMLGGTAMLLGLRRRSRRA